MKSSMHAVNRARMVLEAGEKPCLGIWQMLPGPDLSRYIAQTQCDWVMLDLEHGNIDGISNLTLYCTLEPD